MELFSYLEQRHGIRFTPQQREAVVSTAKNILLLAVPGSGKTTVLTARIASLIHERGVSPQAVLTITFSRETARDMKSRYLSLFGELPGEIPRFSTIHSFSLAVLKYYARVMHRPMPTLLTGEERLRALRDISRRCQKKYPSEEELERLSNGIGYVKNTMISPKKLERTLPGISEIFEEYQGLKRKKRLMDFDDMLTLALEILTRFPSVRTAFSQRYAWVNVDEAQDTSPVQHRLIEQITDGNGIFMVGDEDQSIYSFRGADPWALLAFSHKYPDGTVLKLEKNFRSGPAIVEKADRFIRQNRQRHEKQMLSHSSRESAVHVIPLADYADQYSAALSLLRELPEGKTGAVLYRNNESALPVLDLLYKERIPFYIREHNPGFFTSMVVRDVEAYILLAADLRDLDCFSQIYYKLGYSKGIYDYVREHIREYDSVFDCVLSIPSLPSFRKKHTRQYQEGFAGLFSQKPSRAMDYILEELNYQDYLENRLLSPGARLSAYQKLHTLQSLGQGLGSVFQLLERVDQLKQALKERRQMDREAAITLSTLHSCKGLEFDWVILLDLLENILPSEEATEGLRRGDRSEYENEVRLFYVGATRARERLVLFQSRRLNGTDAPPSRFLREFLEGPSLEKNPGAAPRPSR